MRKADKEMGVSMRQWKKLIFLGIVFLITPSTWAQMAPRPNMQMRGVAGSLGGGYTDFYVSSPSANFKMDRGVFLAGAGERAFDFLNLYMTFTLSMMIAEGMTNYDYTTLSGQNYTETDVQFRSNMLEANLGLKFKLIDNYWVRPYAEAGGIGGYHEVSYTSKLSQLAAQGPDFKRKDAIMGAGWYQEFGLEVDFSEAFGIKVAARFSEVETKKLETLANQPIRFKAETYYLSALRSF